MGHGVRRAGCGGAGDVLACYRQLKRPLEIRSGGDVHRRKLPAVLDSAVVFVGMPPSRFLIVIGKAPFDRRCEQAHGRGQGSALRPPFCPHDGRLMSVGGGLQ